MISIFGNFLLFLFIAYFNGLLFIDFLTKNKNYYFKENYLNFFETAFLGLIITGIISQIINLFFPLNNNLVFLNFLIILVYIYKNKLFFFNIEKQNIVISIVLLPMIFLNIWGSTFHDDLNHYHYSFILNADNFKTIIGYNFLHNHYSFSPIWLYTQAYFNFDSSRLQDIHNLNGLILFLFLGTFLKFILSFVSKKKLSICHIIIAGLFLFVLLKFTRLKEFGVDRPGYLVLYFSFLIMIKYEVLLKTKYDFYHFVTTACLLFLIYNKIIFSFFIIIPIYFLLNFNSYKFLISKDILFLFFSIFCFLLKNILFSGCLIYPISSLCFETLKWVDIKAIKNLYINLESFNKGFGLYSGSLDKIQYSMNFNWFQTWFYRNKIEFIELFLVFVIPFAIIILSAKRLKNKIDLSSKKLLILFGIIFVLSMIPFLKTPVLRINHHIVFILVFLIFGFLFVGNIFKLNRKFIILIILFCYGFNLSKNSLRIYYDYSNNHLEKIKKVGWYKPSVKRHLDNFNYYIGWYEKAPAANNNLQKKDLSHKKYLSYDIIYKNK